MATAKNTICIWYDGAAREAAEFYASVFPDSRVGAVHHAPMDTPGNKEGDEMVVEFTVFGTPCIGLNGGPIFPQTEAFSFQIATDDQQETDRYWNAIVGNGGAESACGWCKDKWGVSWQITPRTLTDALAVGGEEGKRAFAAMLTMQKIDVAAIDAARRETDPMPRKITGAAFLSLDGVMQAPGGPTEDTQGGFSEGGWMFKIWDPGIEATLGSLFSGEYDLLLGRRTYDIFAAYWPYAEGENKPMSEAFERANKYVLTRGDQPLEWANSHRMTGIDDIARVKSEAGSDIIIQGSSTIYPALLAAGLIDELTTMTFPVTLGHGKRLFGEGTPVEMLEMVAHNVTENGTVIATYKPGGALPPYPPEGPIPSTSQREIERQARMREGSW